MSIKKLEKRYKHKVNTNHTGSIVHSYKQVSRRPWSLEPECTERLSNDTGNNVTVSSFLIETVYFI